MSFVASSSHRAYTTTSTPAIPAGTQAGDVMVAVLGGSSNRTVTPPSGWTLISASDGGGHAECKMYIYTKVAVASEPAPTWTWSAQHWSVSSIQTHRDVAPPTSANVAGDQSTTAATRSVPGSTTTLANATVIWAGYWHANGHTSRALDGTYTTRYEYTSTGAGLLVGEEARPTPGATGNRTLTIAPGPGWLAGGSVVLESGSAPEDQDDPTVEIDAIHGSGHATSIHDASGYDPDDDELTVTGSADDDGGSGVALVEVRVNSGSWQTATGTTSWSITFDVSEWAPGEHTIEARATDVAENVSALDSVTAWHSPSGMWGASSSGSGHLAPLQPVGSEPS